VTAAVLDLTNLPAPLCAAVTRRACGGGETLFRQGDPVYAIFAVAEGRIRLVRHGADGRTLTLHVAGKGDSFAEAALFSANYHCDAIADIDSVVAVTPKPALTDAMARDPVLTEAFMALLAGQVRDLRSQIELRNIRSARERIIAWLMLAGADRGITLDRPLKIVASEIGLSQEALYRALTLLAKDGVIERTDGFIKLNNDMAV
jgi:CRP/FNR family transcriptional regulator